MGLNRKTAAEYSFFAAVPVICAASLYDLYKGFDFLQSSDVPLFALGFATAFISAWLSIRFFLLIVLIIIPLIFVLNHQINVISEEVIQGNLTLFMRRDEVDAAWRWIDPIRAAWDDDLDGPRPYAAGTWGPAAAASLIARDGCEWHEEI